MEKLLIKALAAGQIPVSDLRSMAQNCVEITEMKQRIEKKRTEVLGKLAAAQAQIPAHQREPNGHHHERVQI